MNKMNQTSFINFGACVTKNDNPQLWPVCKTNNDQNGNDVRICRNGGQP